MSDDSHQDWTAKLALEHALALLEANDKRYEERFAAQEKAVKDALAAQEKAVNAALAASEKAVSVAETNAERWRAGANEWRAAMNDRERNFLSKGMGYVVGGLSAIALLLTIADKFRG